ncbi:MAG TPA: tRNA preQ1(34) S-adenosylmethionine ribosyltransferase-isomerase QueA [Acidimicrobiia bacterium]|nr:tRNA preQ1(34) S-adenosylmethionine ribosyltransferase-isomerase QueA [Acidimicrobiia bacterium]
MRTSDFLYDLPAAAIAQVPAEPRDSARLLVAEGLADRRFADLPDLLAPGDLVVVNRTRVRRARLRGNKEDGGGRVEALLLRPTPAGWEALVRPARRLRPGTRLRFGGIAALVVAGPDRGQALLSLDAGEVPLEEALDRWGEVPLPPYFTGRLEDPERYQTVYAARPGSAAAPTAGLHFTTGVLRRLGERGIELAAVELGIGVDTFRPIAAARLEEHHMHREDYLIDEAAVAAVEATRRRGGKVLAVGTTVVRALESAAEAGGAVRPGPGSTDLFITPGHPFRVVDLLVTNFHVPGSTLVVLIAAFMGEGWRELYRVALARGYRFLSFGDAMLAGRAG